MTVVVDWPGNIRQQHASIPRLAGRAASGGVSVTGIERVVGTDAGRWVYSFSFSMWTRETILSWRGMMAKAQGRLNVIRVPFCDCRYDAAATSGLRTTLGALPDNGLPHSDTTRHSDGTGYAQGYVTGRLATAAEAGDSEITLAMPTGVVIHPGQFFSDGNRAYEVRDAVNMVGSTWKLTFAPKIRTRIAAAKEVSFDHIYCLMRLASEDMLAIDLELLRFANNVRVDFAEASW